MPQMTIEYDAETEAQLEELKKFFGVKTKAAVIRRALAISRAAKKYSDDEKSVRIASPSDGDRGEVFMLGS